MQNFQTASGRGADWHLETFLLELGGDFCFIGRQKRLRIGDEWYRMDLLFSHRRLRCLGIIDLKIGKFTHADDGQMHLHLNYARKHWVHVDENPPEGLILCALKDEAVARYALSGGSPSIWPEWRYPEARTPFQGNLGDASAFRLDASA